MNGEQQIRSHAALAAATFLSGTTAAPEDFLYVTGLVCAYIRDGDMGQVRTVPAEPEQTPEVADEETHALPDTVVTSGQSGAVRDVSSIKKDRIDRLRAKVAVTKTRKLQDTVRAEIQDSGLDDEIVQDDDGSLTTLGAYADKIFGS